jgi:O-antigen/teichoic acid export membrane protein
MNKIRNTIKKEWDIVYSKGAFHIFLGSFLTKFVAFFGSVFIVRVLSKTEFGTLGYVENLFSYIYIFAGMGLTYALFRYVVLAKSIDEKYLYYNYVIKKSTIYNILLVLLAVIFSLIYPHPDKFSSARWLMPVLLLSLPFHSLTDSNVATFRAMFSNKRYAIASFSLAFVLILTKYILANVWGVKGAVVSSVVVYAFFMIFYGFIIKRSYFYHRNMPNTLSKSNKRIVDQYSIQYMITNSIWAIFMLNDIFLLGQFTGDPTIIANYKIAYVLPANLSIISSSIGIFVAPYFVRNEKNYHWIRKTYKKTFLITVTLIGLVSLLLFIFAKPIVVLLYGEQYATVAPLMRILLVAAFINCAIRYTNANLLAAMGQIKYNLIISIIGVLLQIFINITIIPKYGAFGLAYTSIIVYFMMSAMLTFVFFKKYKIINFKKYK